MGASRALTRARGRAILLSLERGVLLASVLYSTVSNMSRGMSEGQEKKKSGCILDFVKVIDCC